MPISYNDFLDSADRLAAGNCEVDYRNAASRAYYSAYHPCNDNAELLPSNAHIKVQGGWHAQLADRYKNSKDYSPGFHAAAKAKAIGYVLDAMKAVRHKADYSLDEDFSQKEAQLQVANARNMQIKMAEFLQLFNQPGIAAKP